ncbi:hypothetical protein EGW08_001015 [Elysia chlorotica]|uniref:Uncharacterized protein n=1 Tax=Elysia chlorotica TaxID=188477 RepID=A0A433UBK7_ELYCH|nr:hypothetical protein EGW08_001015 [Elysia chlorotica]
MHTFYDLQPGEINESLLLLEVLRHHGHRYRAVKTNLLTLSPSFSSSLLFPFFCSSSSPLLLLPLFFILFIPSSLTPFYSSSLIPFIPPLTSSCTSSLLLFTPSLLHPPDLPSLCISSCSFCMSSSASACSCSHFSVCASPAHTPSLPTYLHLLHPPFSPAPAPPLIPPLLIAPPPLLPAPPAHTTSNYLPFHLLLLFFLLFLSLLLVLIFPFTAPPAASFSICLVKLVEGYSVKCLLSQTCGGLLFEMFA